MTRIGAAVDRIIRQPAPVIVVDTCNFLDLFRCDTTRKQPRVPAEEIRVAVEFRRLVTMRPAALHLVVPELVPGEFADHADRIEREFDGWLEFHDQNQAWMKETAVWVGGALPAPSALQPLGLCTWLRGLANDLLTQAIVLDRDTDCLNKAVARLIARRRPSHKKEIKDSMNMEQSLELCSQLRNAGFSRAALFISSNTNDYADSPTTARLHSDLQPEFTAVSLEFFPWLRPAVNFLRARGELP